MKKIMLSAFLVAAAFSGLKAQNKKAPAKAAPAKAAPVVSSAAEASVSMVANDANKLTPEDMYFPQPLHDFGVIPEGPLAEHEFEFENRGSSPIVISNVNASCGCTTPSYSKEPVLPGKKSVIKAAYNTQGRVSPFTKTITITSNAGIKVLTIKGEVEKSPEGSVPESRSMIKTM